MAVRDVSVRQEALTIPTYPVGSPEPNPMFFHGRGYQGAKGPMYPYPLLDRLSDEPVDRTYQAVYLENPYIELCVLPEIGGRILSGLDKTNGYDFIYRQHVIKPALIGMVGAWISGGAEWNIPHHHRASTFLPVDFRIESGGDGSQTIWLGEMEYRHRMRWVVGITVFPGRSFFQTTIKVINSTRLAHSMLCFTNLATHVNESYQVIFPPSTQFGTQHAKCEFIHWPIAQEMYNGVDYRGVDVSFWKNHLNPVSIFALNTTEDFFGGYDHGRNAGTLHVADHHVAPGQKFFTFGSGNSGKMWDKILTDSDGPYVELMAGAFSDNQPDYSWIQPGQTRVVTETWYPVRGLSGVKNATRDAAVNLEVVDGQAKLAFNATGEFAGAIVSLKAGEKVLLEKKIRITPDRPFTSSVPLPEGVSEYDLRASLLWQDRELVAYHPKPREPKVMPLLVQPPPPPKEVATNEELYLHGLRLEQFHSPALEPQPYYDEALRRDPSDVRTNVVVGVRLAKRGLYEKAREHLQKACDRLRYNHTRPRDSEAEYYLGVVLDALGQEAEAEDAFNRAAWGSAFAAASHCALAEMALRRGDLEKALEHASLAVQDNADYGQAWAVASLALAEQGRFEESIAAIETALRIDPLDARANAQRWLVDTVAEKARAEKKSIRRGNRQTKPRSELEKRESYQELARLLGEQPQLAVEVACGFGACGRWFDAMMFLDVLSAEMKPHPLLHYWLGYCHHKLGDEKGAREVLRKAAKLPPDRCFPFRLEEIDVLRWAIEANPGDAKAPYYLGNLLYDIQPEEAIKAWELSRRLDPNSALVHRNLSQAYACLDGRQSEAIIAMEEAVRCDGHDPRHYFELDELLERSSAPHADRLAKLESAHEIVAQRDYSLLRQVALHVQCGQYDRAIGLMANRHFHIWEGLENSVHDVYSDAHLLKGRQLAKAGQWQQALEHFLSAAEYPERFELGEPLDGGRIAEYAWFAASAYEALGQPALAHKALEQAVEKPKNGTFLAYYQGLAWQKLGQSEKAAALFEELVRIGTDIAEGRKGPDFFEKFAASQSAATRQAQGRYLLALGLLGKGDSTRAREELSAAVKLNMNHLRARVMLEEIGDR